ncbi:MAG TPA: class I SAM-dependent methyltransferase [Gemmata sp.]|jgi:SAM-dependent methyltransferase|nr:class I SAM-dependent methyltransferase [Gemmata sp.]
MVAGEQLISTTPVGESSSAGGHWLATARRWNQIGPPLRPSPEDIGFYSAAIDRWVLANRSLRALILGVTPELYRLSWPNGTNLLAVDRTRGMIDAIWPGPRNSVLCADWTAMPLPARSRDIALCDAGLILVSFPHGLIKIVRILQRVLTSGGLFITRLFLPPAQHESPGVVLSDLLAGSIANLNILKMRLGMALQENSEDGVQLGHIWDVLHRAAPNLPRLAERIGWSLETLSAIDVYRNCSSVYHFSSFTEIRQLFCDEPGGFTCESIDVPGYPLGERCPTVVFRREAKS